MRINEILEGLTPPDLFLDKASNVKPGDIIIWKLRKVGVATGKVENGMVYFKPYESFGDGQTYIASLPIDKVIIDSPLSEQVYRGYNCRKDCSGHMAGHEWAKKRKLSKPNQCPYRPSHPSFWEGCLSNFNSHQLRRSIRDLL